MKYEKLVELFLETPAEEWVRVHGNHEYAYCKADVNLRIVTSLNDDDIQAKDFVEDWANGFSDARARGYFYNLYYGETLTHRFILVSVDGARAVLPLPDLSTMETSRAQWKAAEIFDSLGSLDDYARRAGIRVGSEPGL